MSKKLFLIGIFMVVLATASTLEQDNNELVIEQGDVEALNVDNLDQQVPHQNSRLILKMKRGCTTGGKTINPPYCQPWPDCICSPWPWCYCESCPGECPMCQPWPECSHWDWEPTYAINEESQLLNSGQEIDGFQATTTEGNSPSTSGDSTTEVI